MLRSRRSSVSIVLFLCLVLTSATAFAQLAKPAAKPHAVPLADGVLVDAERLVAYLRSPRGSIDAVGLHDGQLRWSADAAAKPLLAVGDLLIAQAESREAGRLDVVSFDARDGSPGPWSARIELPAGVKARLQDAPNHTFRVNAALEKDEVVLSWTATKSGQELQGYLPSEEEDESPGAKAYQRFEGTVAVDLATGRVRPLAAAKAAVPRPLDVLREQIAGVKGRLFTSADGRHLMASRHQPGDDPWTSYSWTIYARGTGERLGELASVSSTAPFLVADARLLFVSQPYFRRQGDDAVDVPMQVRAIDLASGSELWTKEVGDPNARGPFPP